MARAGKTFFFASLWLDRRRRDQASVAYAFCRMVDDLADELPIGEERQAALWRLKNALIARDSTCPDAAGVVELAREFPEILTPLIDLVDACASDVPGVAIQTEEDLFAYAHGVAGNVGLIMYPILGGRVLEGRRAADALGIAMQCTNIARDVILDARNGRCYLPREWLGGLCVEEILSHERASNDVIAQAVSRLLEVAAQQYAIGLDGLRYLSPGSRFAIRVAADCYAAIGARVVRDNRLIHERAVVSFGAKCGLTARAAFRESRIYHAFARTR